MSTYIANMGWKGVTCRNKVGGLGVRWGCPIKHRIPVTFTLQINNKYVPNSVWEIGIQKRGLSSI